jgi:heat shock protein HtpX
VRRRKKQKSNRRLPQESNDLEYRDAKFVFVFLGETTMKVFRTAFLLTGLTLVLLAIGGAAGGRNGMTIALVFAVFGNAFAYFFSDKIALYSSRAQPVSREQLPRLYEVMERLSAKANLPVPKLYVVPEAAPNAFATGRNPSHASVAVTQGLLELMNDDELEGVIAHELSHVRNYDILISSVAATIAGAITHLAFMGRFAAIFGYGSSRDDNRGGGGLTALLMLFLAPFAAMLLQLGISRQREYSADETGARMVGQPFGLISALQKLGAYNQRIPSNIPQTTAALCIVKPMFAGGSIWASLFSTHPPLEERIAALRAMTISRPG